MADAYRDHAETVKRLGGDVVSVRVDDLLLLLDIAEASDGVQSLTKFGAVNPNSFQSLAALLGRKKRWTDEEDRGDSPTPRTVQEPMDHWDMRPL